LPSLICLNGPGAGEIDCSRFIARIARFGQANRPLRWGIFAWAPTQGTGSVRSIPTPCPLALSIGFALYMLAGSAHADVGAVAAQSKAPACPIGAMRCAKKADDFSLCKPNAMLEFYD